MLKLYVHGWALPVSEDDVRRRFEGLPGVKGVARLVLNKKRFAHVDLEVTSTPEDVLGKLRMTYKNAKWKGGPLQFEPSRPEYLDRLREEKRKVLEVEKDKQEWVEQPAFTGQLRIRPKKGVNAKKRAPHGKLIVFNDDEEDDVRNVPVENDAKLDEHKSGGQEQSVKRLRMETLPIPASQDPAYCCTTGDAGPSTVCLSKENQPRAEKEQMEKPASSGVIQEKVRPMESHPIDRSMITVDVDPAGPEENELAALAKFVGQNCLSPTKAKKNSSKSILGQWFAQHPPGNEEGVTTQS